ncbi:hypothetical protein [Streptomyces sp. NPDC051636]|uniref:hypothetical protein n=1 Tax=Streptomyces sp. NPDC051636 TaxID=3365663 RepID=UPI0037A83F8F
MTDQHADFEPNEDSKASPKAASNAELRTRIAHAIHRYDNRHALSGNDIPSKHHYGEADFVLAELRTELDTLAALRQVSRGYCPTCGRGDAAPTVEDWEQQRDRADQLARILAVVLAEFRPTPGTRQATAVIDTDTLHRWHTALDQPTTAATTCSEHDGPCFPDPTAKCPAHGDHQCAACHRNPSSCNDRDYVECGYWSSTGMHWDTCSNRIRGPLTPDTAATQATVHQEPPRV